MQAFSMDNIVFRTIGKIVDLVYINFLTLICSLPVITAGAAITAMYYNLLRMAEDDEGALTRGFFKAFRENFKKATKVWICMLGIFMVLGSNLYIIRRGILDNYGSLRTISLGAILLLLALTLMLGIYIFSLIARYENTLKHTIKNACLLSVAFFPRSLCMVVILFFPIALMTLSNYFLWFWFLYGLAFPGYFVSMLMVRVLRKVSESENEEEA